MAVLEWTRRGSVAILTMTNGENRHNPQFVTEMLAALDAVEADAGASSLIIASNDPKNFCQGIDLAWMTAAQAAGDLQAIRDFLYGMNRIFIRLLTYPLPAIAALGGHVFGNGAILACACDFRFMRSDRGFFCFPEVDINIPLLPGMQAIVKKAFPAYKFNEAVLTGKRMTAPELEAAQVIAAAFPDAEALLAGAVSYAETFAKGRGIFEEMKRRIHRQVVTTIEKEDPAYIEPLRMTA